LSVADGATDIDPIDNAMRTRPSPATRIITPPQPASRMTSTRNAESKARGQNVRSLIF
jgi:hypothetical protein